MSTKIAVQHCHCYRVKQNIWLLLFVAHPKKNLDSNNQVGPISSMPERVNVC